MPEGWKVVPLGEAASINPKCAPLTADSPFITMSDVSEWGRWAASTSAKGARGGIRAEGGDVLVARITPCLENGKIAMVPRRFAVVGGSTEFIVLRGSDQLLSEYLYLWASESSNHSAMVQLMIGSTGRQRVSAKDLASLPLHLPPIEEQRRIVDLVGSLDEALDAADAAIRMTSVAAAELRRATFEALVTRYPSEPAGQIFSILLGRQKSARQSVGNHVIPYIRAGNLSDGSLSLAVVQTMNFDPREQAKYCLEAGDVLIAEGGSVGQSAVWNGEIAGPVGFDKHVLRVRGVDGRSVSPYAFQWARWCYESGQFAAAATGITIKALGFDRAKRISVPAAPLEQQLEAIQHLTAVDDCAAVAAKFADSLRTTRSELLSVLLSGEHEIPESYDIDTAVQFEPAA